MPADDPTVVDDQDHGRVDAVEQPLADVRGRVLEAEVVGVVRGRLEQKQRDEVSRAGRDLAADVIAGLLVDREAQGVRAARGLHDGWVGLRTAKPRLLHRGEHEVCVDARRLQRGVTLLKLRVEARQLGPELARVPQQPRHLPHEDHGAAAVELAAVDVAARLLAAIHPQRRDRVAEQAQAGPLRRAVEGRRADGPKRRRRGQRRHVGVRRGQQRDLDRRATGVASDLHLHRGAAGQVDGVELRPGRDRSPVDREDPVTARDLIAAELAAEVVGDPHAATGELGRGRRRDRRVLRGPTSPQRHGCQQGEATHAAQHTPRRTRVEPPRTGSASDHGPSTRAAKPDGTEAGDRVEAVAIGRAQHRRAVVVTAAPDHPHDAGR